MESLRLGQILLELEIAWQSRRFVLVTSEFEHTHDYLKLPPHLVKSLLLDTTGSTVPVAVELVIKTNLLTHGDAGGEEEGKPLVTYAIHLCRRMIPGTTPPQRAVIFYISTQTYQVSVT